MASRKPDEIAPNDGHSDWLDLRALTDVVAFLLFLVTQSVPNVFVTDSVREQPWFRTLIRATLRVPMGSVTLMIIYGIPQKDNCRIP